MAIEAQNILRGIGGALTNIAPLTEGPWALALRGLGAAVTLVGELIAHGADPVVAIQEIQSVLPDYQKAKGRLQDLVDQKAGGQ